jgi:hypothetical protein
MFENDESTFTIPVHLLSKGNYYLRIDHGEDAAIGYAFQIY